MPEQDKLQSIGHRVVMAAVGGVAGLALWGLGEQWDDPAMAPALFLAVFIFVSTYASVAMALAGPVSVARALRGALLPAVALVLLVSLAGMRYVVATDLLDDPVILAVAAAMVLISTPFVLVWLQRPADVLRYDALFDAAWSLTVRYSVAWVFLAVFWLIIALSDTLLDLVDIGIMDFLMRTDWVRFVLSGAVLGFGLAVVHELRRTISPDLLLRLLRLLVPLMLAVVAVFLLAMPLRGLNHLFGEFTAAGTLLAAAAVAVTLISTALDRNDSAAVQSRGLKLATGALSLLLPPLTALAVWAVAMRVRQYGWTPDRILAMAVALFLLSYGVTYCGSVLLRGGWMARIRQVNVAMALIVLAVSMLWMTPVLDVYRISTTSQINRFQSGQATQDQLALWPLAHMWGRAGQSGLVTLEAKAVEQGNEQLAQQITAVRAAPNRYRYSQQVEEQALPDRVRELMEVLPIRPQGATLDADVLTGIPSYALDMWQDGCERLTAEGRPGCVLVKGRYVPWVAAEEQAMVLYLDDKAQTRISHVTLRAGDGFVMRDVFDTGTRAWPSLPAGAIAEIQDGKYSLEPSGIMALSVADKLIAPAQ